MTRGGVAREDLFFKLAIADLQQAADLFRPIHDRTDSVHGWVSLEVPPLLTYDTRRTVEAASSLHAAATRPNLFIKIPRTKQGISAIEEATFRACRSTSRSSFRADSTQLQARRICAAFSAGSLRA